MRLVLAISFPGIGLFILNEPILRALFQWGAFDSSSALKIVPLVAIYGLDFIIQLLHSHARTVSAKNMSYPTSCRTVFNSKRFARYFANAVLGRAWPRNSKCIIGHGTASLWVALLNCHANLFQTNLGCSKRL